MDASRLQVGSHNPRHDGVSCGYVFGLCCGHTAAYWLLHGLRDLAPKTSFWRDAQLDTLRLAFVKIAARVTELATRIEVSLPSSYPHKASRALRATRTVKLPP